MKNLGIFFIIISGLFACSTPKTDNAFEHTFEGGAWNKFTEIVWDSVIVISSKPVYPILEFEVNSNFIAEEISFQMIVESSNGESRNQAFQFPTSGFTETNNSDTSTTTLFRELKEAGTFSKKNIYHIEIVSMMTQLHTPGIQKIRLKFEE